MYAIIEDSGTQIRVSQGDVIKVAIRDVPEGTPSLTFDKVLFLGGFEGDQPAKVGSPVIAGAKVTGDVLAQGKTPRVEIRKIRRRKNYRRHRGHRQDYLQVKITAIEG